MGIAALAPWDTIALTVEEDIVILQCASMELPAYLSLEATDVFVIMDTR